MSEERPFGGIRLSRGTHFVIPAGSLTLDVRTGEASIGEVHLQREMYPVWIEMAVAQLAAARAAHGDVLASLESKDEEALAAALDLELSAGMLAVVAASTALDALYASVKQYISVPPSQVAKWRANHTARWRQVAEVLRLGFRVHRGAQANLLRKVVKEVYRYRDMTVHPSSEASQALLHPDLGAGTDWRFVSFSYAFVLTLVWAVLGNVRSLTKFDLSTSPQSMRTLADDIQMMLEPVYEDWERVYGPLNKNPGA